MDEGIYETSDGSLMTEEDVYNYIGDLKLKMNDFIFDDWFAVEDFKCKKIYTKVKFYFE